MKNSKLKRVQLTEAEIKAILDEELAGKVEKLSEEALLRCLATSCVVLQEDFGFGKDKIREFLSDFKARTFACGVVGTDMGAYLKAFGPDFEAEFGVNLVEMVRN